MSKRVLGVMCVMVLVGTSPLFAGVITYHPFDNDAESGLSASKTYTHALDLGNNTSTVTINGVQFTSDKTTTSFDAPGTGDAATSNAGSFVEPANILESHGGNSPPGLDAVGADGVRALLTDMWYLKPGANFGTLTLTGLTSGQTYDLRLYVRKWDVGTRINELTFNGEGTAEPTITIYEDDATQSPPGFDEADQPYYINYRYTATDSGQVTVVIDPVQSNECWHLYGLTNEVIESQPSVSVPEPAGLGLLGLALLGLRKRRS